MNLRKLLVAFLLSAAPLLVDAQCAISVHGSMDYLPSDGVWFTPYKYLVGVEPNSSTESISPRLGIAVSNAVGKFRVGGGIDFFEKYFDVTVHRYALYYSPGGNVSGGDIYDPYYGHYNVVTPYCFAEYFLPAKGAFQIGWNAAFAFNLVSAAHVHSDYYTPPWRKEAVGVAYLGLNTGPVFQARIGAFGVEIKPGVQLVFLQTQHLFSPVGALGEFGLLYYLPQRTKEEKKDQQQ